MRVVVNEAQIKRNRQISHILFFISLAGMGIGFFYTWTADPTSNASQISCFILPVLMLLTLSSVRMANTWIREPRPKDVLAEALKGLGKKYVVFHYVMPAPHVLIGPEGVFTITPVWQEGEFKIEGKKWRGEEGISRKLIGYLRQDLVGNPFTDANFHAQQVQRVVDKIAPDSSIEVQPLVVLIHPEASFEAEDPLFPVLYADPKQRPALREYIKDLPADERQSLSEDELDQLDQMYGLLTRQEIAEMLGQADDDESAVEGDVIDMPPAEAASGEAAAGTVFVAQAGQLYYIGTTDTTPEDQIKFLDLADEVKDPINVIHSFEDSSPEKVAKRLRDKYDRKRQKEHWYGLSKKDVSAIKDIQGDQE